MAKDGGILSKPIKEWTLTELKANPLAAKAAKKQLAKVQGWLKILREKDLLKKSEPKPKPKPKPRPGWKPYGTKQQKEMWKWMRQDEKKKRGNTA